MNANPSATSSDEHRSASGRSTEQNEIDELLDRFLDVASGERTAQTRARYATALGRLRPVEGPLIESASWSLLLRVSTVADAMSADASDDDSEGRRTVASLYERLVRWLVRNTDAGTDDARCLVLEAGAGLRRLRARDVPPMGYPALYYPEPLREPAYLDDERWGADVTPIRGEWWFDER